MPVESDVTDASPEHTECKTTETVTRRNLKRTKRKPVYLQDYETEDMEDKLKSCVDSCYKVVCDIPQTYQDAKASTRSRQWKKAMDEEMQSLEENKTFRPTQLPPGKQTVGDKWVYTLKSDSEGSEKMQGEVRSKRL